MPLSPVHAGTTSSASTPKFTATLEAKRATVYPCDVDMFTDDDGFLCAKLSSERVYLEPPASDDQTRDEVCRLYATAQVMQRFGRGMPYEPEQVSSMLDKWRNRWNTHDPFSGFVVRLQDTDEFLGTGVLGHSGADGAGQAELAGIGSASFWRKGLGTEAGSTLVHSYADALFAQERLLDGARFDRILATARLDNAASSRVLEKLGFQQTGQEEKFGAQRGFFLLQVPQMQSQLS